MADKRKKKAGHKKKVSGDKSVTPGQEGVITNYLNKLSNSNK